MSISRFSGRVLFFCCLAAPAGLLAQTDPLLINANCISTCTGNLGDNIFPDGDFGSGLPNVIPVNPNLAPGYTYQKNPPPNDGSYSIANSTVGWGSFAANTWIKIEDKGPEPNGYMMVVNASYQPGLFYQKVVQVCENTLYEFSIDVISMNIPNPNVAIIQPEVAFEIDGVIVCSTNNIPIDASWYHYRFSFTTLPGVTQVTLSLRNNAPGGYGNDLAIDNISFRACGPNIDVPVTVFFCAGQALTLQADLTNSPYNDIFYQWQFQPAGNPGWQDMTGANAAKVVVPSPADGDIYRLVVANTLGNLDLTNCSAVSDPIELMLDDVSGFAIGGEDTILCNGAPAVLRAGNYAAYQWSTGAKTPEIKAPAPGWYAVTVTTSNGCTATDSLYVYEVNLGAQVAWKNPGCPGDSTGWLRAENWQGGVGPLQFALNGGPFQDQPFFDHLPGGNYVLELADSIGCRFQAPVQIADPPPLAVSLGPDRNIYACDTTMLLATVDFPATQYSWQPAAGLSCVDCPNPVVMPAESTFYTVKVTNDQGCSGTDSLLLTVLPRLDVYAPNVFRQSFSNNTENNVFTIFTSKSAVLVKRLDVYNRWGELVFQKKEQLPAAEALRWDGTDLQGRLLADGVFVWLAEVTFTDGQTRVYSGDVTLLTGN